MTLAGWSRSSWHRFSLLRIGRAVELAGDLWDLLASIRGYT